MSLKKKKKKKKKKKQTKVLKILKGLPSHHDDYIEFLGLRAADGEEVAFEVLEEGLLKKPKISLCC